MCVVRNGYSFKPRSQPIRRTFPQLYFTAALRFISVYILVLNTPFVWQFFRLQRLVLKIISGTCVISYDLNRIRRCAMFARLAYAWTHAWLSSRTDSYSNMGLTAPGVLILNYTLNGRRICASSEIWFSIATVQEVCFGCSFRVVSAQG